ncbi:GxxExxY protein, partial [Rhodopirellula baltica]|uniref:GxxExxY protein n=1 Tax=Rhodopirellula baltica TaxID=265606 RepID=UPI001F3BED61
MIARSKFPTHFDVDFCKTVDENALAYELRKHGLDVMQQAPIKVHYEQIVVGEYFADLLVSNAVI